jgi:hypothetical protein
MARESVKRFNSSATYRYSSSAFHAGDMMYTITLAASVVLLMAHPARNGLADNHTDVSRNIWMCGYGHGVNQSIRAIAPTIEQRR